ncbi:MAG: HAMP domain-containing histidine kinase [Candidatus Pacebacteria bacterium]|nr:HAMP domain-containing histidine kinase [Candidatus Paceibacterota bacterium]
MSRVSFRLISDKDVSSKDDNRLWNLSNRQTDFVSMATHQIKTPLSGIKWTLNMLLRGDAGPLTDDQKEWLQTSYESNERVLSLIDEMLESIRIDEDKLILEKKSTDLVSMFRETLKHLDPLIRRKSIKLSFRLEPEEGAINISADGQKLQIAFQNLVENAIRYTREGGNIDIIITKESGDIKVSIKDNGIGIPEQEKKDIFARFFRASNAYRKLEKGSGLGLFIARGIVEKHGGKMWFESKEKEGSTFYFIIPTT